MSNQLATRLKKVLSMFIVALTCFELPFVWAGNVTIHVKDGSGTNIQNANVYAVNLGSKGPDGTQSQIGVTDASGNASFALTDDKEYEMLADKNAVGPTARAQFFDPAHLHLSAGATGTSEIVLDQTFSGRGTITVNVTNATHLKAIFGTVRKKSTGADVAFAAGVSDNTGAVTLTFNNVPPAAGGAYNVGVFDQAGLNGQGQGNGTDVSSTLAANGNVSASVDISQGLPPDGSSNNQDNHQNNGPTNGASVSGVVEDFTDASKIVPFGGIQFSRVESGAIVQTLGAPVDQNGRFSIGGLVAGVYFVDTTGGCNPSNSLCYSGYSNPTLHTSSPVAGLNDFTITSGEESSKTNKLEHIRLTQAPEGTGKLKIKVKNDAGTLIPGAFVNINGDGSLLRTGTGTLVCDGSDPASSNAAFYQKNAQASDGNALFEKIPNGNLMISVNTPFSRDQTVFNAGADKTYSWGQGVRGCSSIQGSADDLSVNMNNGTVVVKDMTGHTVDADVVLENSIPTITIVVPTSNSGDGTVNIVANFPEAVDLAEPITFVLQNCDSHGCTGNFGTIIGDGTAKKSYTTSFKIPTTQSGSPASYFMQVTSNYWGVVRNGGGDQQVSFKGQTETTIPVNFAHAGRVIGKLYKPDGTLFLPQSGGNNFVGASVNAQGDNNWGNAQVNSDGSFTIGGLLAGKYKLVPQEFGSSDVTLASKIVPDEVIVTPGVDLQKNVSFANGVLVAPTFDLTKLVDLKTTFDSNGKAKGETYDIVRVKSGTALTTDAIRQILVHNDENSTFEYSPAGNTGRCGPSWPGGVCPGYQASGDAYDFLLARRGNIDGGTHQYMTFLDKKENVSITQDNVKIPLVSYQGSNAKAVHVDFTTSAPDAGVSIQGTVLAENMLRAIDFAKLNGSFDNFINYIPLIIAKNQKTGKIIAAVLVTPAPELIAGAKGDELQADVVAGDYTAFSKLVGGLTWGYEFRGLPANTDIVLCATTPNYPPAVFKTTTGSNSSSSTWDIDWDKEVGTGGTITGDVVDASGAPIPNAVVAIKAPKFAEKTYPTDDKGVYTIPGLPKGLYTLTVTALGKAPSAKRDVISGSETDTVNLTLTDGPGSIAGTVTQLTATSGGIVNKPVEGAIIMAYDDTINASDATNPLAVIRTNTASDGTYTLTGFIPTHSIVVICRTDGNYPKRTTATATTGAVTGVDFKLSPKPLDVDVVVGYDEGTTEFVFKILNPKNFDSGRVWYYNSAAAFDSNTATEITSGLTQLPDGSLVDRIASSAFTAGVDYKLHIVATPADGSPDVTKEVAFSLTLKNNSLVSAGDALQGDDSDNNGTPSNEVTGADGSSIAFEPGATLQGAGNTIPSVEIAQLPPDAAEQLPLAPRGASSDGDVRVVGSPVKTTLTNMNFTSRPSPLTIPFNSKDVEDITNLALYRKDATTGLWVLVSNEVSVEPVSQTATGVVSFGDVVASDVITQSASGIKVQSVPKQMSAMKSVKGFSVNPRAMTSGSATFSVGIAPGANGNSAVGYHQYNFPNPFNLKDKTVTLRAGTSGVPTTIRGTYIVVAPTGSGNPDVTIRIYNVAGDMVRELKGAAAAGKYNYFHWDGRNTSGGDCASGVYFARVDAPGAPKKEPIKMVLVK